MEKKNGTGTVNRVAVYGQDSVSQIFSQIIRRLPMTANKQASHLLQISYESFFSVFPLVLKLAAVADTRQRTAVCDHQNALLWMRLGNLLESLGKDTIESALVSMRHHGTYRRMFPLSKARLSSSLRPFFSFCGSPPLCVWFCLCFGMSLKCLSASRPVLNAAYEMSKQRAK